LEIAKCKLQIELPHGVSQNVGRICWGQNRDFSTFGGGIGLGVFINLIGKEQ
jgi:hypothetical protein